METRSSKALCDTGSCEIGDLSKADDGRLLIGMQRRRTQAARRRRSRIVSDSRAQANPNAPAPRTAMSIRINCFGTAMEVSGSEPRSEGSSMYMRAGQTYLAKSDGLSGDIVCSLFEDREGNVWVATTGGLDRFRELPVTTISAKQGLSSDATNSVLAAADGSIWVATHDGLTRWKNGQITIFRKASGLPDDVVQSSVSG